VQNLNKERKSSCKDFYIVIQEKCENKKQVVDNKEEELLCEKLNDKYFKIKECLARCGNTVIDSSLSSRTNEILYSFFNTRKDLLGYLT